MSIDEQLVKLIEHYRKAVLIAPSNIAIYHQLAELYYQHGELGKTLEICQQALQIQLHSALVFETLSKVLIRLGFNEKEIQCLSSSFPNTSTLEEAFSTLVITLKSSEELKSDHDVKTWKEAVTLGHMFAQQRLWKKALQSCFKATELEPSLNFPHFIVQYFVLPEIDDLNSVVSLYSQVIELPKIHSLAYTVLGDILTKQNKLSEAICAYRSAWLESNYQTSIEEFNRERTSIDYLIIGVGKAGTSSLFYYLSQHPQIINPHKKEILFFNKNFEYGLEWYLAQFPPTSVRKKFLTGEATPWYLGSIGVEERVFQSFPQVKLIAILRNPVARTISQYYMHLKMGLEHRSLQEVIGAEMAILGDVESLDQVSETYWKTERGYLLFSLYLPFLKRWMSLFPKEQLLILDSENLYNKPSETLKKVFNFLSLPEFELISYPKLNLGSYSQVNRQLRKSLFDFFCIHNQKLEEYLGMEFGWNNML